MERQDYIVGYDRAKHKSVNAANLEGSERFGMDIKHTVVLSGEPDEVEVLMRGLDALRAQAELQTAVDGSTTRRTDRFTDLHADLAAEHIIKEGFPPRV